MSENNLESKFLDRDNGQKHSTDRNEGVLQITQMVNSGFQCAVD